LSKNGEFVLFGSRICISNLSVCCGTNHRLINKNLQADCGVLST